MGTAKRREKKENETVNSETQNRNKNTTKKSQMTTTVTTINTCLSMMTLNSGLEPSIKRHGSLKWFRKVKAIIVLSTGNLSY